MSNKFEKGTMNSLIGSAYEGVAPCNLCGAEGDIISSSWTPIGKELSDEGLKITFMDALAPDFTGGYVHVYKNACKAT
jgi:hypothetical protein